MNRQSKAAIAYILAFADLGAWWWALTQWPEHMSILTLVFTAIGFSCLIAADRSLWG